MKCSEIIKILETLSPRSMACDWDNPGLLAGRSGKEVKTIFLAVDATDSVIEQAEQAGAVPKTAGTATFSMRERKLPSFM